MAYTPYYPGGWQSGEEGGTPITPAALNHIENGIANLTPDDIGAPGSLNITSTDTLATIIAKLEALEVYEQASFYAEASGASILTGGKVTSSYKGIMARLDNSAYDLLGVVGSGANLVSIRIIASNNSITVTLATQFSGTAI